MSETVIIRATLFDVRSSDPDNPRWATYERLETGWRLQLWQVGVQNYCQIDLTSQAKCEAIATNWVLNGAGPV
jgi:hypothetical protein